MNNRINFHQVVSRFEENNLPYALITLQNDFKIIISQRGGRIFGPFFGEQGESILWINNAFAKEENFKAFLKSGNWNLGGDRMWLAPELQYNVKDRRNFSESYDLPVAIDPGNYSLETVKDDECILKQNMFLKLNECISNDKNLYMQRRIKRIRDPLSHFSNYSEIIQDVLYAGFEHEITLSENSSDSILSETWNLTQLNPGGEMLISSTPKVEFTDYYEPIEEEYQKIFDNHIRLKITGEKRYKVGYKATNILGRVGYYNEMADGNAYLFVRHFFSNPSAPYTKEPADKPACNGHSLHVYNDNGDNGGFAELECSGQPIGGITKKSSCNDLINTWLYMGNADRIKNIAQVLLGISI